VLLDAIVGPQRQQMLVMNTDIAVNEAIQRRATMSRRCYFAAVTRSIGDSIICPGVPGAQWAQKMIPAFHLSQRMPRFKRFNGEIVLLRYDANNGH
jgi:hypothetical protein